MIILTLGVSLNTKTSLGVTPIIAPPFAVSEISHANFGNVVLVCYSIFLLLEMIIHWLDKEVEHKQLAADLLQLPVCILFSRLMNIYSSILPDFAAEYKGMFIGTTAGRIMIVILAVILTGVGAAMTLNMRLVPNTADGLVQALSDFTHCEIGTVRNLFDLTCVLLALAISLISVRKVIGIGIGTLIAALGAGRVIAAYHMVLNKFKSGL